MFDTIYAADLRYLGDCWKLCGDAHCCSFSRYKARFRMIARTPFQELPLLPGEYEYLEIKGWLAQFGDYEHNVVEVPLNVGSIRVESIISRRPNCACDQDKRPTICRLYPLLPVFDIEGRVISVESMGIYEVLEDLQGLARACQLTSLPFSELRAFFAITAAIAREPLALFYVMAYRAAKEHVRSRLAAAYEGSKADAFIVFERLFLRKQLMDDAMLRGELNALAERFQRHYGPSFRLL